MAYLKFTCNSRNVLALTDRIALFVNILHESLSTSKSRAPRIDDRDYMLTANLRMTHRKSWFGRNHKVNDDEYNVSES